MKLGVYEIINDPHAKLHKIRDIECKKKEFLYQDDIIKVMNRELKMDKLNVEHMYAVAMARDFTPKGILLCSVGGYDNCLLNKGAMAAGLLLLAAERFVCFHNHPGYDRTISDEDYASTDLLYKMEDYFELMFDGHFMITKGYHASCEKPRPSAEEIAKQIMKEMKKNERKTRK